MRILGEKNWLLAILTWKRRFLRDQRNDSLLYLLKSHYPWLKVWCTGLYLLVSHIIFYLMSEIMNLPFNFPTLFLENQHNVKRLSTLLIKKNPLYWTYSFACVESFKVLPSAILNCHCNLLNAIFMKTSNFYSDSAYIMVKTSGLIK